MATSDEARSAAAQARCSTVKKSVPAGRWGPCCSVAPSGRTTVVWVATARSCSRVISAKSRRFGFIRDFRRRRLSQSPVERTRLNRNDSVRKRLTGSGLIEAHDAVRAVVVTGELGNELINLNRGPFAAIDINADADD